MICLWRPGTLTWIGNDCLPKPMTLSYLLCVAAEHVARLPTPWVKLEALLGEAEKTGFLLLAPASQRATDT